MSSTDTAVVATTEAPGASGAALPQSPSSLSAGWTNLVPMLLIFAVFYFLLIRPQEKKRKAQEELVGGVKKGEEVLTTSGIYGTVTKINDSDHTIELTVANDLTIKMLKSAIADIVSRRQKGSKQEEAASKVEAVQPEKKTRQKK
ncbi:MAG: preprotein translocase subunit YajC [Pseudomonadota bacterium]